MSDLRANPYPRQRSALEPMGRPRTSRRAFLVGSGAVVLSGLMSSGFGAADSFAHDGGGDGAEPPLGVWAATKARDRYLSLFGTAAAPEIRELGIEGGGTVVLGDSLGVSFPDDFVPVALHAVGSRLLAAGATVRENADSVLTHRPALHEVVAGEASELPLGEAASVEFGVVTAVAHTSERQLAVIVESSDDIEQAYNDITRVAESDDGGASWRATEVATGLGEGEQSHLAALGSQLFTVTVDGWGERRFHQRATPGNGWEEAPANGGQGPVQAMVAVDRSAVDVVERSPEGQVRRSRWDSDGADWADAGKVDIGEDVLEVLPVSGTRQLIAMGESDTRLVS